MRVDGNVTSEPDLTSALEVFARDGYCVIEGVLEPDELARLRDELIRVADVEREATIAAGGDEGPHNQRVYALTHKGEQFLWLLEHPLLWSFMPAVLGPDFLLSSITANIAGPGGAAMYLHPDQLYIPPPWPPYPLVANMMWMLDDFTSDNGATRVVPGSHIRFTGGDVDQGLSREAVAAVGTAGSVLCFDGRLLHQTGPNTTEHQLRRGILTYCCRPWIRQQENASVSVPESMQETLSERVRQLIGLKLWAGLGSVDGPSQRGLRTRSERP